MSENVRYRSQTVSYLGFLQTQLRDLQGIGTLAYELIQNADDVLDDKGQPAATRITFDICEDALIVENDGIFREVDFDRISEIAGGKKREEHGTTGAFGIGFISVYQVTDSPEIFSNNQHWRIRPNIAEVDKRIEIRDVKTEGTKFRLPWAFDAQSEVRRQLKIEPVDQTQFDNFQQEISQAISLAALFLKQLQTLELKQSGQLIKRIERVQVEDGQILIQEDDHPPLIWSIFRSTFDTKANQLRQRFPLQIEAKRQSEVLVAIPDEPLPLGRLFAVLPTETTIPLPFHINADFFPSNDRKHIIFGSDYQSEWNRAAIKAAAQTVADNFDKLRELLRHEGIWQVLQRLNDCRRQVEQGEQDQVFAAFWEEIAPRLHSHPIVFTTTENWVTPDQARLLESDAEEAASSIFENLGIHIVHPDLRQYFGLLRQREIGTPILKISDIAEALTKAGFTQRIELFNAPKGLNTVEKWEILWHALDAILDRRQQTPAEKDQAINLLRGCAIAFDKDNALWPPTQLFQADDPQTRTLFSEVNWIADNHSADTIPESLVPRFTAEQAILRLNQKSIEYLEQDWHNGSLNPAALYRWFEDRKSEILYEKPILKSSLRALSIWPSSNQLKRLTNLYIPGGFDDELKLSGLVDLDALGGRREFLKDLGVQELTFETYLIEQVPQVLQNNPNLTHITRRKLVRQMAQRLGEIRDNEQIRKKLSPLPIVECTDKEFRPALKVYLNSSAAIILGERIYVARTDDKNKEAVEALYRWLGVVEHPRADDVISRVRDLTASPPTSGALKIVEAVFEYLVESWQHWNDPQKDKYVVFQQMAWLPGSKTSEQWFSPPELYAVFQKYLFESQANFLEFPQPLQNRAGTSGLIEFLKINDTPTPALVVRHVLEFSRQGKLVNKTVYRFLNDKADDEALDALVENACLLLPTQKYVAPSQVFWSQHPFGRFRDQLGPEFRSYQTLLDRLAVKESPDNQDFIDVLLEISQEYEQSHSPLDDPTLAIVMRCWERLSTALDNAELTEVELHRQLHIYNVIPDNRAMLNKPNHIFFEDRAGLAARFPVLEHNVIVRPQGAWRAMAAVGVQLLGKAIEPQLVECEDPVLDTELNKLLQDRRSLIDRVIETEKAAAYDELNLSILENLHFKRTRQLMIQYSLHAFVEHPPTAPEAVPVLLLPKDSTVYVVRQNGQISWAALAREIAAALKPMGEIGGLAGGIKEVLTGDTPETAAQALDDLGYPPLQQLAETAVTTAEPIAGFGGDDRPVGEPVTAKPPDAETDEMRTDETAEQDPVGQILGQTGQRRADMPPTPSETPATGSTVSGGDTPQRPTDGRPPTGGHPPTTGQRGTAGGGGRKQPQTHRRAGRLRTYVTPDEPPIEPKPAQPTEWRRPQVGQDGVERVLAYEAKHGRTAVDMNTLVNNHPGYDVKSEDATGNIRYIEVKAKEGLWDVYNAAGLSRPQFDTARDKAEQFWLYVVEQVYDDDACQIYRIQNPANRVNEFLFDDGWRELAEAEEIAKLPSTETDEID